jgi:ADP-ribosylation factor-like protein 6
MGIFSSKEQLDVICCGLDNSGKSTIINSLKPTKLRSDQISATVGYQVEEFEKGKVNMKVYDMGGAKKFRSMWDTFYQDIQGIIFVIDSADKVRMTVVKDEIREIVENERVSTTIPILFYANKMDIPGSFSPHEIVEQLELDELLADRPWNIFASDARRGVGLEEGVTWLQTKTRPKAAAK